MKKILAFVLATAFAFGLVGCDASDKAKQEMDQKGGPN
jgi:hypothetical protein